jgi:CBS-domain-containing membrane protein
MSCSAIMTRNPLTLHADESVAAAATKLIEQKFISLPVVDSEGCYAGMFGVNDLLSMLVPRIALAGDVVANLRFIGDDPTELRKRYTELKSRRAGDSLDPGASTLTPDTPENEAIRLLCQGHNALAIIDPATRKVVGVITCWDAIRAITGAIT